MWNNEHISWDPAQFCGITQVSVPRDMLWRPDLFIYEDEIRLLPSSNSSRATQFSREVMKTQGEWEFLQLSFTIRRRPLLHVINFLLPILFFLSLDLASFFISDHRGEKLGFKVTVLLAISVLLLILNDILPSMSNTERDKAPPSPYLTINDKGDVEVQNDQVLVSTCRMHIYNFPFDIQRCSLSFKSVIHT
uniref:Si:dkey-49c17.4 n=1 Tax=Seriola dumerili TaxID=41447 RepID=A0A3B4UMH1_SERDU